MSLLPFRTQAHHLPELADQSPVGTFASGPHADESDYAAEYATALICDAMDAARLSAPPVEPDPDGARLMAEYALHQQQAPTDAELAADEDVSAFLDASRDAFIDWLSTMGSDHHRGPPGCRERAAVDPGSRCSGGVGVSGPLSTASLAWLQSMGYADEAALDAAVAAADAAKASDARLDALVRRDLADSCRALRMRLAATACATATPSVWFDLSLDAGNVRTGLDSRGLRNVVEQAAGAMARSRPDLAAQHLAEFCGLDIEAWAERVLAETAAVEIVEAVEAVEAQS